MRSTYLEDDYPWLGFPDTWLAYPWWSFFHVPLRIWLVELWMAWFTASTNHGNPKWGSKILQVRISSHQSKTLCFGKNEADNKLTEPNQLDNFNVLPNTLPATKSGFAPENFKWFEDDSFLFEAKGLLSELLLLVSAVVETHVGWALYHPPKTKKQMRFATVLLLMKQGHLLEIHFVFLFQFIHASPMLVLLGVRGVWTTQLFTISFSIAIPIRTWLPYSDAPCIWTFSYFSYMHHTI